MANKRRLGLFFLPGWILAGLLLAPQPGLAHPLGNFSVNHYAAVRVERDVVELHYVLDMAEIPDLPGHPGDWHGAGGWSHQRP